MYRVKPGKRTEAISVHSSCFGCLTTLQQRHLETTGSCLFAGTSGESWVRCGFCCLFERLKRVFRIFIRVLGCRKMCDLLQGAATEFSFFLSRNNGNRVRNWNFNSGLFEICEIFWVLWVKRNIFVILEKGDVMHFITLQVKHYYAPEAIRFRDVTC